MMRKVFSVALMATLACVFGLSAKAGVTIDVAFQSGYGGASTITVTGPLVGTGCTFGGYYSGSTATGICMDILLTSDEPMRGIQTGFSYDTGSGLAIQQYAEWVSVDTAGGIGMTPPKCSVSGTNTVIPGSIRTFDCLVNPAEPISWTLPAGTYRIGTIIWDASAITGNTTLGALVDAAADGVVVVRNGVAVTLFAADIVQNGGALNVPEPGTAALLGLGLVGLIITGRRSRA